MLTLIKSPFLEYKLTILRNKRTKNSLFRQTMNEISYLIASEVLKHIKYTGDYDFVNAKNLNLITKKNGNFSKN